MADPADDAAPDPRMTLAERWDFLRQGWVAVISVPGDPGVAAPVWIHVDGDSVLFVTPASSEKARAIEAAGHAWVTAQNHESPYRYVSAEGPAAHDPDADLEAVVHAMSLQYFGPERGPRFAEKWLGQGTGDVVFRITPRRWRSFDESRAPA